ncbi:MAG: hypothetical protein L6247_04005 [Desulfobacteraceae bacterium]|nr:hypothetical protein [Pseudomonadota bacterium]MBU4464104.1 hypothetical protein [Pseudomonadota bacterium]MCG2754723.1 hypothetical protein [Desulfobacteraceae bacterium]
MSFKENLLKKIKIDKMTGVILNSIGPPDSGRKLDKQTMRSLLEMGSYQFIQERDLDLYILQENGDLKRILVLDNGLAIYNTTVEDVVLRKSPTVKEMLNIRNIIKILNDKDVVLSKREESVKTIQKECIDMLDLSYNESDIEEIGKDGTAALERGDADGVIECLTLFAELLEYSPPPKAMKTGDHHIIGALSKGKNNEDLFGPVVMYSLTYNLLKLIDRQISSLDKGKIELMHQIAIGKEKASKEGPDVFNYLKEAVILVGARGFEPPTP